MGWIPATVSCRNRFCPDPMTSNHYGETGLEKAAGTGCCPDHWRCIIGGLMARQQSFRQTAESSRTNRLACLCGQGSAWCAVFFKHHNCFCLSAAVRCLPGLFPACSALALSMKLEKIADGCSLLHPCTPQLSPSFSPDRATFTMYRGTMSGSALAPTGDDDRVQPGRICSAWLYRGRVQQLENARHYRIALSSSGYHVVA